MAVYEDGQVVFSEGEKSDFVGYIVDGEAEVCKRHGSADITVGRLNAGEYIGEMAAIEGRAHGATVRASSTLVVERLEKTSFLERASHDNDLALLLLKRLSQRLHTMDDAYAAVVGTDGRGDRPSKHEVAASSVTLFPGSSCLARHLPAGGLVLDRLPFLIGRTPSRREQSPPVPVDLRIDDPPPYRLSRSHFSIDRQYGQTVVRDLNSHLGTRVNKAFIGRFFPRDTAELSHGENVIIAGGKGSPYEFRIVVGD